MAKMPRQMKTYLVKTESVVTRYYYVDAKNEDEASELFLAALYEMSEETEERVIEVQEEEA